MFGFCMGGTLVAIALAWLAAKGEGDRVAFATMIGSLFDFAELGQWATFSEPEQLKAMERHLDHKGFMAAQDLQALFSAVRANDLIWSSVVSHYLLDREAPPSDILYWFADGAHIPRAFLLSYATQLLRDNLLKEPGGVVLDGVPLDLGAVQTPLLAISLKDDHVSAWSATYEGARLFGGPVTFLLGGSGHNAGVINPPAPTSTASGPTTRCRRRRRPGSRARPAGGQLVAALAVLAVEGRQGEEGPGADARRGQARRDRAGARLLRPQPRLTVRPPSGAAEVFRRSFELRQVQLELGPAAVHKHSDRKGTQGV
jgi:hypothetical protein